MAKDYEEVRYSRFYIFNVEVIPDNDGWIDNDAYGREWFQLLEDWPGVAEAMDYDVYWARYVLPFEVDEA